MMLEIGALERVAPGQFQSSSDGKRVFFVERDAVEPGTGRNVFILSSKPDSESVTSARSGRIELVGDDRFLQLSRGQQNEENLKTGDKTLARFEGKVLLIISGADLTAKEFLDMADGAKEWRSLLDAPRVSRQTLALADHTFSRRHWRDQIANWTGAWLASW